MLSASQEPIWWQGSNPANNQQEIKRRMPPAVGVAHNDGMGTENRNRNIE